LASAAWLRHIEPQKSVAVFESYSIGAGASGHTGGMALAESAAGDLPGLGNVLGGLADTLKQLDVDCDLALPGAWEVARRAPLPNSPIAWNDSGDLRATKQVPGGTIDPGRMVSGLARSAERLGAQIFENAPVENIEFDQPLRLVVNGHAIQAGRVLLATNAMSLELSALAGRSEPKLTLAVASEPLPAPSLSELGLASGMPFYTVDFPYLWGRIKRDRSVIFGSGLVHVDHWRELEGVDVANGQAAELLLRLEARIRALHPILRQVQFTHRWGGPILIADEWRPIFEQHPRSAQALLLGAYSGHGVALSVYLGRWAAEVMCGRRSLPDWKSSKETA
jgi:glycine/D-amino acid oxidase-like deaminating enzyme